MGHLRQAGQVHTVASAPPAAFSAGGDGGRGSCSRSFCTQYHFDYQTVLCDEWLPSCDAASALPSRAALPPQFFPLKTVDFVRGSTSNVGTPDAGGLSAIRLARCACHSHASRCWPWVRCGSSRIGSAPCRSKTGPDRRGAARRDRPRSRP